MFSVLQRHLPWKWQRQLWLWQVTRIVEEAIHHPDGQLATDPAQPTIGYCMWKLGRVRLATTAQEYQVALALTPLEYAPIAEAARQYHDQRLRARGYRYWNFVPGQDDTP